jgi:hypothetical protein
MGAVGLTLLGAVFLVAGSQEPILWRTLRSPKYGLLEVIILAVGGGGMLLALALVVLGARELFSRWRAT